MPDRALLLEVIMCDVLNLDVQAPIAQLDMVAHAYRDFRRNPDDWNTFDAFDWAMRVLSSKWSAYASARRVNACREESGADNDEIIDLLG